jgi:rhamnulokinase
MSVHEIYWRTGVQFMQHNTLFQLYSMVLAGSPLLKSAATYLMTADLFNYWMCGQKCCEFTNATTTQFFDPYIKDWCLPVLGAFAIPVNMMPPIVSPSTRLGRLKDSLLDELPDRHAGYRRVRTIPLRQSAWCRHGMTTALQFVHGHCWVRSIGAIYQ